MDERLEKLKIKFDSDPNLAQQLSSLESLEEVQKFFKELEVDFSLEEIAELKKISGKLLYLKEQGELTDETLEVVIGGASFLGATLNMQRIQQKGIADFIVNFLFT